MFGINLKLLLLLAITNVTSLITFAQHGESIVIVASDEKILMPSIEKILDTISFQRNRVFDQVTNLNEINRNIEQEKDRSAALHYLTNRNIKLSVEGQQLYNEMAKRMTRYTYFLNVHISKINTLLEIQFYLYKTNTLKQYQQLTGIDLVLPQSDVRKPEYYTSFIVDLTKDSYNDQIYYQIKKMLPAYNYPPEAIITNDFRRQSKYNLAIDDTLRLSAINSTDREIKNDQLKFEWSSVYLSKNTKIDSGNIVIIGSHRDLNFSLRQPGAVKIFLRVFDGASFSKFDSVTVQVNMRPLIRVEEPEIRAHYYKTIFQKTHPTHAYYRIQAENYSSNPSNIKIERYPIDSVAESKRRNKGLFAELYRRMSRSSYLHYQPTTQIEVKVDSANFGYIIALKTDPDRNVKAKFKISAINHDLKSNQTDLRYAHTSYTPIAFTLSLQNEKFVLLGDSLRQSQIISQRQLLRFGIAFNLWSGGITGDGLLGSLTFKIPKTISNQAYLINSPFEATIYYKKSLPIPIAFGLYSRYVWIHRQEPIDLLHHKIELYDYVDYGMQVGFDIHPVEKWPIGFSYLYGVTFNTISIGSDRIGNNWGSFSIRYYIKNSSF